MSILPAAAAETTSPGEEPPVAVPRRVEIGWMVAGALDQVDLEAASRARDRVLNYLQQTFGEFDWQLPLARHEDLLPGLQIEPVVWFEQELIELDAKRWDFALLLTSADLVAYDKPFCLAALSRSFEVGVISTARVDPGRDAEDADDERRTEIVGRRIAALAIHILGHLNGLDHDDDPSSFLYEPQAIADLDKMRTLPEDQLARFRESLVQTADLRLEEREEYRHSWRVGFYLRSIRENRRQIVDAVIKARPWQFPLKLSGLTTAALSVMLILLMTAEVWELGTAQSGWIVAGLSLVALAATTIYAVVRQRLLLRRDSVRLSELTVIRNVSTCAIVLCGMITTYVLLFVLMLGLSALLFSPRLAAGWAASLEEPLRAEHYFILAAFVSSFGIFIGALGLSFEDQHYFRHVTYVDEEI